MDQLGELFVRSKSTDEAERREAIKQLGELYETMTNQSGWHCLVYHINALIESGKNSLMNVDPENKLKVRELQLQCKIPYELYSHVTKTIRMANEMRAEDAARNSNGSQDDVLNKPR